MAGWQLTLVVLAFFPAILLMGKVQARRDGKSYDSKTKNTHAELAGEVDLK